VGVAVAVGSGVGVAVGSGVGVSVGAGVFVGVAVGATVGVVGAAVTGGAVVGEGVSLGAELGKSDMPAISSAPIHRTAAIMNSAITTSFIPRLCSIHQCAKLILKVGLFMITSIS
jgi:hypothetical protein